MKMESFPNNEIFENKLQLLKKLWEVLKSREFNIGGRSDKIEMMPFEEIEQELRARRVVPLSYFGLGGLRASFDRNEGVRLSFTNSFSDDKNFEQTREEIKNIWEEIKNED